MAGEEFGEHHGEFDSFIFHWREGDFGLERDAVEIVQEGLGQARVFDVGGEFVVVGQGGAGPVEAAQDADAGVDDEGLAVEDGLGAVEGDGYAGLAQALVGVVVDAKFGVVQDEADADAAGVGGDEGVEEG